MVSHSFCLVYTVCGENFKTANITLELKESELQLTIYSDENIESDEILNILGNIQKGPLKKLKVDFASDCSIFLTVKGEMPRKIKLI